MTTPIDRESVERPWASPMLSSLLEQMANQPSALDSYVIASGASMAMTEIRALRAALDAAEAEKQLAVMAALRDAAALIGVKVGHGEPLLSCGCAACRARREDHSEILALIPDAGAALDRALAAQIEKDAKVAETHPMRFAGQTEDDVRAALAAAIRAQ